jgi:hypothetical protein
MRSSITSDSQTCSGKTTSMIPTSSSTSPTKCPWEVAMVMEAIESEEAAEVVIDADMTITEALEEIMEVIMIKTVMKEREKSM